MTLRAGSFWSSLRQSFIGFRLGDVALEISHRRRERRPCPLVDAGRAELGVRADEAFKICVQMLAPLLRRNVAATDADQRKLFGQ